AFLACTAPRLVAPAMNGRMYEAAATRENLERLRTRGIRVIEPEYGDLASRDEYGLGRLPEPARLLEVVQEQLAAAPDAAPQGAPEGGWRGRRVLVTAGGTREPVDPVRYLGNRSSGRMGMALAAEALARGAEVTLITANVALPAPAGAELVEVETTAELAAACATAATAADLILMAAAPADFTPRQASTDKLARGEGAIALELEPTDDILAGLAAARPPGQRLVGFAAESGGPALQRAREKLTRKGVDLIVLNDVSDPGIGFDSAENEVTLISDQGERQLSRRPKRAVAAAILDHLEPLG
ncbi:MAG TPA: bifunctional phosphopantothenoylcysteine decarboxylase/phosphopantothenate--cysteine ligase CoaBC, partial [Solirubrobacterales bacterium]|nr:bifunctional phosphopantothenoylcysteine decarboxylase/phosphopantothenate--cysteine ligase CoaBC [Solirubrobacterales bacterium]